MNWSRKSALGRVLACLMLMGGLSAFHALAGIIDFSGLANGTPVSDGNPYATLVYLQATTVQQVLAPGVLGPITTTQDAAIQNGQAAVVPQYSGGRGDVSLFVHR